MGRRSTTKAEFYALCGELRACGLRPSHIAQLLGANTKYTIDVLCELGLYKRAAVGDAERSLSRVPAGVRGRVVTFREQRQKHRPMLKVRDNPA